MDHWFDTLARAVAGGQSRREMLKRVGVVVGATLVAAVPEGVLADETSNPNANAQCAEFCVSVAPPGPGRGMCISDAAHDMGLCFGCGPSAPAGHPDVCGVGVNPICCPTATPTCCGGVCVSLTTVQNCGTCGNACAAGQLCCNGVCTTQSTANCGACGHACTAGQLCCNGVCTPQSPTNCGACGVVCPGAQICLSGGICGCLPTITCVGGRVLNPTTCTCECPSGTALCASTSTCVSTTCPAGSGETYNATTCACECPPGQAVGSNGVCTSCGTSFTCGSSLTTCGTPASGGSCVCLQSVEGFTACGENFSCGSTITCTTSAQCVASLGLGSFCQASGTGCCGAGVCVPACGTTGFFATPFATPLGTTPSGTPQGTNAG